MLMPCLHRTLVNRTLVYLVAVCLALLLATAPVHAQISLADPDRAAGYPPDLPNDIPWRYSTDTWEEMVAAFNAARSQENVMLGSALPPLTFPAAATWAAMSSGEKTLWLVNEERTARGLAPLQGLEENVNAVAQGYAEWLLVNNAFNHRADGRSPWERLDANPAIGTCHDFLSIAENLYYYATSQPDGIPFFIEQAVYIMLYEDAVADWGHRHAILWTPYTENSGAPGNEGFLGVGHASGDYYTPPDGTYFARADIFVMNFFDPCATWAATPDEGQPTPTATPSPTPTALPTATATPTPTTTPNPIPQPPAPTVTPSPDLESRTITGQVITLVEDAGQYSAHGLADVTIVSDDGQQTQTDATGRYTLTGLPPGVHHITPSKEGYSFAPATLELDLTVSNLEGVTFVSSAGPVGTENTHVLHLPLILPN